MKYFHISGNFSYESHISQIFAYQNDISKINLFSDPFSQLSPPRGLRKSYIKTNYTIGSDRALAFHWYTIYFYRTMASRTKIGKRVNIVRTFYDF